MLGFWVSIGRWFVSSIRMPGDVQDMRQKVQELGEATTKLEQRVTDLIENDLDHIRGDLTALRARWDEVLEETVTSRVREEQLSESLKEQTSRITALTVEVQKLLK